MNKILKIRKLAENVFEYVIDAPVVAKNAMPGQFVILRVDKDGERIPFTICDMDKINGSITLLVQIVGYTTHKLSLLKVGDMIEDFVGPLGNATDLSEFKNVLMIGGGIGSAVVFPQSKLRHSSNQNCDVIIGARNKDLVMYQNEFEQNCDNLFVVTDDGSLGEKGFVTSKLEDLIKSGKQYDCVFAVGPAIMMKMVCLLTLKYQIKTIVSMNAIMVDGTGMCGGCRLTVGGVTKYACVDGPEFDGHLVDFDEAMLRGRFYKEREADCFLRGKINGKN